MLPLPLLSNPDSSTESEDNNTELDPATSETTSIVPDLEATSFIRKDQAMQGHRDLSLAAARSCA